MSTLVFSFKFLCFYVKYCDFWFLRFFKIWFIKLTTINKMQINVFKFLKENLFLKWVFVVRYIGERCHWFYDVIINWSVLRARYQNNIKEKVKVVRRWYFIQRMMLSAGVVFLMFEWVHYTNAFMIQRINLVHFNI